MNEEKNNLATWGLIFGILSMIFHAYLFPPILALIFGIRGLSKSKELNNNGRKKSIAAIILGGLYIFQIIYAFFLLLAMLITM